MPSDRARQALFLDFDGTLAPISPDPGSVRLSAARLSCLERIASRLPVFVISGRGWTDLLSRLPVPSLAGLSGDHGAVRRFGREISYDPLALSVKETLARLFPGLDALAKAMPGLVAERKDYSLTLHYRALPDSHIAEAWQRVSGLVAAFPEREVLRISPGKRVWEIRPRAGITKEDTLEFFLGRLSASPAFSGMRPLPVMAGDDTTDLGAISRAIDLGGTGYWVGKTAPPDLDSRAGLLADPDAVWRLIGTLSETAVGDGGRG